MRKTTVDLSGFGGGYEAMCQTMLWRGVAWLAEVKPNPDDIWPPLKVGERRREDTPLAKELERAMLKPGEDATGAMFGAAISSVAYIARHGVDGWLAAVRTTEPERMYEADVVLDPADSHHEHATPEAAFNAGKRLGKALARKRSERP